MIQNKKSPVPLQLPFALFNGNSIWGICDRRPAPVQSQLGKAIPPRDDGMTREQGRQLWRLRELEASIRGGNAGAWDNSAGFLPHSKQGAK